MSIRFSKGFSKTSNNNGLYSLIADKPTAPLKVHMVEQYKDAITIGWSEPESDGGSRLTGYVIEKRDANRTLWTQIGEVGADVHQYKASKLYEGSSYMFRVAAENAIGQGPFGNIDEPVMANTNHSSNNNTNS